MGESHLDQLPELDRERSQLRRRLGMCQRYGIPPALLDNLYHRLAAVEAMIEIAALEVVWKYQEIGDA